MIVCVCHRVSDKEIHHHASEGKSFEDIQIDLGVATQCGRVATPQAIACNAPNRRVVIDIAGARR